MKIIFDVNSFGVSMRSLKMLENAITKNANKKIAVVQVQTSGITCGFMIFQQEGNNIEVVWTGDGFRVDKRGEGGAAYNTALSIFELFQIAPEFSGEIWGEYDLLYSASEEEIRKALITKAKQILPTITKFTSVSKSKISKSKKGG